MHGRFPPSKGKLGPPTRGGGEMESKSARSSSVLPVSDNRCKQTLFLNKKFIVVKELIWLVCVVCGLGGRVRDRGSREDHWVPP